MLPRSSGVLLHISSLPSASGIGDLGESARAFIDHLADAGQSWWQILPLNPPACENSPYSSYSAFACNPLLISVTELQREGLLRKGRLPAFAATSKVRYAQVARAKLPLLSLAFERFLARRPRKLQDEFDQFCEAEKSWLGDYALFMTLRESIGRPWPEWPGDLALRKPAALRGIARDLHSAVDCQRFQQFIFARQFAAVRRHARSRGIGLIGDMPMFVAHDSADVWSHRELFELDRAGRPTCVSGAPPDSFCKDGQLWGNPLYDWHAMARTRFHWWAQRVRQALRDVDLVRIDHFRGLEAFWRVPAKARRASVGRWTACPGRELLVQLRRQLGSLPVIAEDLGVITTRVDELRDEFALAGMKVLQFAFDGSPQNPMLPHNHVPNSLVYPGTHDNDTAVGWWRALDARSRARVRTYLPGIARDPAYVLIEAAMASVARVAIIPMQDLLRQGTGSRMNTPGRAAGNWQWRMRPDDWKPTLARTLRDLTIRYGRAP